MDKWKAFGAFVSKHMVPVVLIALTCGIAFPHQLGALQPAVPFLFAFATFQNALGISLPALKQTVLHPAPTLLALAYVHVASPLIAFALGTLAFGFDPDIVSGIVLEYSVPAATSMIMWVGMYKGDLSQALATLLVSTLIAPFTIPATLQLILGVGVTVDAGRMIGELVGMIGLPAVLGVVVNTLTRGWGNWKLSPALAPASRILIPLIVGVNSTSISAYLLSGQPEVFAVIVFIGFFAVGNFFLGMGLAAVTRQSNERFVTTTFSCGMKNITVGAVVATQYFPAETVLPVIAGTLFQQLLASVFGKVVARVLQKRGAHTEKAQA